MSSEEEELEEDVEGEEDVEAAPEEVFWPPPQPVTVCSARTSTSRNRPLPLSPVGRKQGQDMYRMYVSENTTQTKEQREKSGGKRRQGGKNTARTVVMIGDREVEAGGGCKLKCKQTRKTSELEC